MLIGKQFKIESDNLNVILYEKKTRKNKETKREYEDWETMGYFATPKGALIELVNQKVRDTELKDLKTIVSKLEELEKLIRALPKASQAP